MYFAFSLQFLMASLVSGVNSVSPVYGSFLPRAGLECSLDEEHLYRSNQSSSMLHTMCASLISFRKYLSHLCSKYFCGTHFLNVFIRMFDNGKTAFF